MSPILIIPFVVFAISAVLVVMYIIRSAKQEAEGIGQRKAEGGGEKK